MREGWEIMHIYDICDKASSGIAQKDLDGKDGDFPIYGASGFIKNVDFYQRPNPYIGIVKDGSGVGRVNTYPSKSSLIGTMQYIIPKSGFELGFVSYALKSLDLKTYAMGAAIPHIYFKDYSKALIPVPPLSEQQEIVEELDLLNGIIEKKNEQLRELDNLAQATFYDMFGDPIENEKGWKIDKIGNVCVVERGGSPRPIDKYLTDAEDGVNWIKIGDAEEGSMYISSTKERIIKEGMKKSRYVQSGDFLLTNSMSFGKPYILKIDGCIHDGWLVLHDGDNVFEKIYLYYFLGSDALYSEFSRLAKGGVVNNLNSKMVREVNIAIPPIEIQKEFSRKINKIEAQKSLISQSIQETQTLLDATMDKYFG